MPTVDDYPNRPWSKGFSLGFGPLFFDPPSAPPAAHVPVTGATGSTPRVLGDQRPGGHVRPL